MAAYTDLHALLGSTTLDALRNFEAGAGALEGSTEFRQYYERMNRSA